MLFPKPERKSEAIKIECMLSELEGIAMKIEKLEARGEDELANRLRLKTIYQLYNLFKQLEHKRNKKLVLKYLLWWIEQISEPEDELEEKVIDLRSLGNAAVHNVIEKSRR